MTPREKRDAAIALGELNVAYSALVGALDRLQSPIADAFVPAPTLHALVEARTTVDHVRQGLHFVLGEPT